MITRYRIVRGNRPPAEPLPQGLRQDTRKHTRHVLRPTPELVAEFLVAPDERAFSRFRKRYLELLNERFNSERTAFETLADLARCGDVFIGCNCPTAKQPDVSRCHTTLALRFLRRKYPDLDVRT